MWGKPAKEGLYWVFWANITAAKLQSFLEIYNSNTEISYSTNKQCSGSCMALPTLLQTVQKFSQLLLPLFFCCTALLVRPFGLLYGPEISATKLLCCTALYGLLYGLYSPQKGYCMAQLHPEISDCILLPLPSSFSPQLALNMTALFYTCSAAKLSHSLQL